MPPTRQPHDPFTDAPLRPTTSNATSLAASSSLRSQTSQHSLRSNASAASTRPRQQRDLFAPALSRRPTSRATPRVEDGVLVDSDSEQDLAAQRQRHLRRFGHGSPEGKHSRLKAKQDEDQDFVNRRPDGSYLLGVAGLGETVAVPQMSMPKTEEELDQAGDLALNHITMMNPLIPCRSGRSLRGNIATILRFWCVVRREE